MTDTTTRLSLPLIAEAQAQKHVTHNEGLLMLDALVQAAVKDRDLTTPPATPAEGEAWIVAAGATDAWSGQDNAIAVWQNGAWRFFAPAPGWRVWIEDEGLLAVWDGSAWIRASGGIGSLNPVDGGMVGINTTADATNRLAVKSDAVLFSHDDVSGSGSGDVRVTVNKASAGNAAGIVFQDGFSGRAELGLSGDDDFRIKVSPDGTTWHEALAVDRNDGSVTVPAISGDGSGLTNVNAERLGGDPASAYAKLSGAVFTGGVTAAGFTGDGGGLTNVNADYLGGKAPSAYALLSGADFTGAVSAASFSGDGSGLTNVDAAKLGGRPASDYALAADVPAATRLNPADGGMVGINTTADATNRLAVKSDAVLFSHDDVSGSGSGDVRFTVNKATAGNTASLLFQDAWSGRAELGLTGDDDFRIKVSADGGTWKEALVVDGTSAAVSFPNGHDLERHLPASVDVCGGADWWGPADHMTLCYSYASGFSLLRDRMYFMAFYVPRPLLLLGGFVSLHVASTTAGAVIRAGVYKLGQPDGNNWNIGPLVADFGSQPADAAGNKIFDLSTPVRVDPGWYVTAVGVNGDGAGVIQGRWLTPGTQRVFPYGTGSSARPRVAGHSVYLYEDGSGTEIAGGLPSTWTRNPVNDASSTYPWVWQMLFPKWRELR